MKRTPLLLTLLSLCASTPAFAVEQQVHVGAGGGLSILKVDDKSTASVGAGAGIDFKYGLSDAFNLHVELSHSVVALEERLDAPTTPHTRPAAVSTLGAGVAYVLDIVRIVPYGGLLAGAAMLQGGTLDKALFLPDAQLALGADYYLSRNFAVGLAYRQHFFLTKLSTYPSYSNIWLRAEYTWW